MPDIKKNRLINLPAFSKLSPDLEREFRDEQRLEFSRYFRLSLLIGVFIYVVMIVWDWLSARGLFDDIILQRVSMISVFIAVFSLSFIRNFYKISQHIGAFVILALMLNVTWTQAVLEKGLEEGYGMLVTPGATTSVIVFSGAEMGYGALLTPLLLLPIGFTAFQSFIVSLLVFVIVNVGMGQAELPSAFVSTVNSVFIGIGIFTVILSYLVNQQRRTAFKLRRDLQAAHDIAEEASKSKSTLIATMSHEVRNFINGIIGITSYLQKTKMDARQEDSILTLKYSGETLLAILNDALDLSKMEAGKLDIEKIDIDTDKLVYSVTDLMRSRAEDKGVSIRVSIDTKAPCIIRSDPTRLRQVLMNLLSNAIKYTEKGNVSINLKVISITNDQADLRFEISDTGIGISKEALGKLFNEYAQADASTYRKYGGTGLGLHICKRIIEIMGGTISAESVAGKGSTFSFQIPVEIGGEHDVHYFSSEKIVQTEPMNILLVEDDKIISRYTSDLLATHSHKTTSVHDGNSAIKALEESSCDLVLMDLNMPDMNGLEVTRKIREMGCSIPIIGLSGNTRDGIIDESRQAGMNDYLLKPIDRHKLFHILSLYGTAMDNEVLIESTEGGGGNQRISTMINDFGRDYTKEMVAEFTKTIHDKIEILKSSINDGVMNSVITNAHDITSMSGTIGLEKSCSLFRQIEMNAAKKIDCDYSVLFENAVQSYEDEKVQLNEMLA